jgi:hypothetical protein
MGNKGAFITLKGDDLTPKYTTYEAVVSIFVFNCYIFIFFKSNFIFLATSKCSADGICKLDYESFGIVKKSKKLIAWLKEINCLSPVDYFIYFFSGQKNTESNMFSKIRS